MSTATHPTTAPAVPRALALAEHAARRAAPKRLLILAYHGVDDPETFAWQMARVQRDYSPVSTAHVTAAFRGEAVLPPAAVWITFDDGLPSVVEHGLPTLTELGVPATMFVCPGLVESGAPNWWDVVATAAVHDRVPRDLLAESTDPVTGLKTLPDAERRAIVDELSDDLARHHIRVPTRQLSLEEIDRWRAAGNDVGNHSWDHPCLDMCPPEEQRRQVVAADSWLAARGFDTDRVFAYPNGNATPTVEQVLTELDYQLALAFDHRVAQVGQPRFRVSRLRVSSSASPGRFVAILSGLHSSGYHLKRGVSGRRDTSLRTGDTVDDRNRHLYEQSDVVEEFAARDALFPCERVLIDTYVAPGADVLDVGVGGGRTTSALREIAGGYVGIDYSAPMIDAARVHHPGARLEVMDAADLGAFADASFDVVLFSFNGLDYLHPVARRRRAIDELARVVRPGGTVIVSSHNARALARPRIGDNGRSAPRAMAAQVVMSTRLAARALASPAYWNGEGYVRDTASPHTNFVTTPEHLVAEFARHRLTLREIVGSRHPTPLPSWMEPWYYYAFRREPEPG